MPTTLAAQSVQVKVTLPAQLQAFAQSKAAKFGMTLSSYIKHLVLSDVRDMDVPTFPMGQKTERVMTQAIREFEAGKTTPITNVDTFLDTL